MRYRNIVSIAIAFAAVAGMTLGARTVEAQAPAAKSSDASAASIASGKRVFAEAGCSACHGVQAQGTQMAPAIAPPPTDLPGLITYARQPTGKMPPVPVATASDKQLGDIFAYLQSIAPKIASAEELKETPITARSFSPPTDASNAMAVRAAAPPQARASALR